jgi:predicted nucleic acid-binding protein
MTGFLLDTNVPSELTRPQSDPNATALEHDLTVVTRNVRDFADLGVALFDPWSAA